MPRPRSAASTASRAARRRRAVWSTNEIAPASRAVRTTSGSAPAETAITATPAAARRTSVDRRGDVPVGDRRSPSARRRRVRRQAGLQRRSRLARAPDVVVPLHATSRSARRRREFCVGDHDRRELHPPCRASGTSVTGAAGDATTDRALGCPADATSSCSTATSCGARAPTSTTPSWRRRWPGSATASTSSARSRGRRAALGRRGRDVGGRRLRVRPGASPRA